MLARWTALLALSSDSLKGWGKGGAIGNILIFPIGSTETKIRTGTIILVFSTPGRSCGHACFLSTQHRQIGNDPRPRTGPVGRRWNGPSDRGRRSMRVSICDTPGFWTGSQPFPRSPWYVSADGMALQRVFQGFGPAATLGLSPTASYALSQNDLDQPFQSGIRMLVGHNFDDSPYQVEASYFWLSAWDTSAQVIDPTGSFFSPFTNFGATIRPAKTTSISIRWWRSTRSLDWRAGRLI